MKNLALIIIGFIIIISANLYSSTTLIGNKEGLIVPYPHWHYFDPDITINGMGTNPFYVSGPVATGTDNNGPNRGVGAAARQYMFVDGTGQLIMKYDMSGLGSQAWYVVQLDNNWKIEFSNDNVNWTLGGTNTAPYDDPTTQESKWEHKPYINESPYCFDLSPFLPADYIYVKIADASTANGWGGRAWNALITTKGYPYFFTGGNEPTGGGKWNGDQQWLYFKNGTSDRETYGRFADLTQSFAYKFDLPDNEDNCWLHTRVSGEFVMEISTNNNFSTIDLVQSNPVGVTTEKFLQLSLANVLAKTSNNVIFVRFRDNDTSSGNGAWPKDFWISPHPTITKSKSVFPCSEKELFYLWYNNGAMLEGSSGFRFADGNGKFAYMFNFGAGNSNAIIGLSLNQEFLIEGSSNNTDWVALFRGDPTNSGQHYVLFNPFNGCSLGYGLVTETNVVFCPNIYNGETNVFFIRISDIDPSDGWGGLVRDISIMIEPKKKKLFNPDHSFSLNEHIVSASLFHWYTPKAGQLSGPWLPREGRPSWTGSSEWWKSQVKQIMLANIDVLNVILIPEYELQRINLFRALYELRMDGYDVPKVVPFLDPIITWGILTTKYDLSQQINKDKIINAYKRFFKQYFFVNTDDNADDYIGIIDNKVVLDVWHLDRTFDNISSFTRSDIEDALSAEFGAQHPIFNNGVHQITTKTGTTFSFADEKVAQFEVNDYANETYYNGIRSYQLKGGYWDQNVRAPGSILKRDSGVNYSNVWTTYPDPATVQRVYIESWNEYDEGSGIFAANPTQIYRIASNTSTDDWSAIENPLEYIETTFRGVKNFKSSEFLTKNSKILWHNLPTSMSISEVKHCTVIVRNEGFDLWSSTNVINVPNAYYFGEHDTDSQDFGPRRYSFDNLDEESDLYLGIFKGRPIVFDVTLYAPGISGTFETHWQMLQESVAWFGEEITNTITVIPEPYCLSFIILCLLFFNRKN